MKRNLRKIGAGAAGSPLVGDGHLGDEELLLAVDGELPPASAQTVTHHLEACRQCREHKQELERTLTEIVAYEKLFTESVIKPHSQSSLPFRARLNELAALDEEGADESGSFFLFLRTFFARPAVLAACMVLATSGVFLTWSHSAHTVSAAEILHRAASSEEMSLGQVSQPVIVQKLSIRVGDKREFKTFYRDLAHERQVQHVDMGAAGDAREREVFARTDLSWDNPLSADGFRTWWQGIAQKQDIVRRVNGNLLQLDTVAVSGPVEEATLTVRPDDYHPVAETLRLRDDTTIEIAELSYSVAGLATLAPDIFGSAHTSAAPTALALAPMPHAAPALHLDSSALAASELAVAAALHAIGADLGEQLTMRSDAQGTLQLYGVVSNSARREQILDAVAGIPFTSAHIESADALPQPSSAPRIDEPQTEAISVTEVAAPLLDRQLVKRFPNNVQRAEFIQHTLAVSQDATLHSWAISRLAQQFGPNKIALLNAEARRQLSKILFDHLTSVHEDVTTLHTELDPLLQPTEPAINKLEVKAPEDSWNVSANRLRASAQSMTASVEALLAGSSTTQVRTLDSERDELLTSLTVLQSMLDRMKQQICLISTEEGNKYPCDSI